MLKDTLIFIGGSLFGGFIVWKVLDKKYQEQYEKDLSEMEFYNERKKKLAQEEVKEEAKAETEKYIREKKTYSEIAGDYPHEEDEPLPASLDEEEPFSFIDYEDFMEYDGKEKKQLILYGDDILAIYDDDEIVDAEEYIGLEAINYLKRENVDEIYIFNREKDTEFQVTKDKRGYTEVTGIYIGDRRE